MYFLNKFKKIFTKSILCTVILALFATQAHAIMEVPDAPPNSTKKKPTVAVITDIDHRAGTVYLVTGSAADIMASDLITKLNRSGHVYAPVLGESMAKITKNLDIYTQTFFNEYKYNYNIDYLNLQRVTRNLNADYLIMVTSGMDVQSNFLKETFWNKIGVSGMDPIEPTYRLTTMMTLLDLKTKRLMWQEMYTKDISGKDYDIGLVQFSPSYTQLSKIKAYSENVSNWVTPIINVKIDPSLEPEKEVKAVEIRSKQVSEDKIRHYPYVNKEKVKENLDNWNENVKTQTNKVKTNVKNFKQEKVDPKLENQEPFFIKQPAQEASNKSLIQGQTSVKPVAQQTKKPTKKQLQDMWDQQQLQLQQQQQYYDTYKEPEQERYIEPVQEKHMAPDMKPIKDTIQEPVKDLAEPLKEPLKEPVREQYNPYKEQYNTAPQEIQDIKNYSAKPIYSYPIEKTPIKEKPAVYQVPKRQVEPEEIKEIGHPAKHVEPQPVKQEIKQDTKEEIKKDPQEEIKDLKDIPEKSTTEEIKATPTDVPKEQEPEVVKPQRPKYQWNLKNIYPEEKPSEPESKLNKKDILRAKGKNKYYAATRAYD